MEKAAQALAAAIHTYTSIEPHASLYINELIHSANVKIEAALIAGDKQALIEMMSGARQCVLYAEGINQDLDYVAEKIIRSTRRIVEYLDGSYTFKIKAVYGRDLVAEAHMGWVSMPIRISVHPDGDGMRMRSYMNIGCDAPTTMLNVMLAALAIYCI